MLTVFVGQENIKQLLPPNQWSSSAKPTVKEKQAPTQSKYAMLENRDMSDFHELVPEMAIEYPFELDFFQKEAIYHLEQGGMFPTLVLFFAWRASRNGVNDDKKSLQLTYTSN